MKPTGKALYKALAIASAFAFCAAAASVAVAADAPKDPKSPVGVWKTIDDNTGKARSLVTIWEHKGKVYGKISKLFDPEEPNPKCDKCEGSLKDKPVIGMTILRGLEKDDDEWTGGTILDPETGNVYKCYVEVTSGGKKLKVRGYIGISLVGRTQYWVRVK